MMERIASFQVDHTVLEPGLYFSRSDGHVHTFDLRFKRPNTEDLLTNSQMHTAEHLIATMLRNSPDKESVIYFGPMGCQTGFYFLFDSNTLSDAAAIELLKQIFRQAGEYDGPMPGNSPVECGNYRSLNLEEGKKICAFYADLIADWTEDKLAY